MDDYGWAGDPYCEEAQWGFEDRNYNILYGNNYEEEE